MLTGASGAAASEDYAPHRRDEEARRDVRASPPLLTNRVRTTGLLPHHRLSWFFTGANGRVRFRTAYAVALSCVTVLVTGPRDIAEDGDGRCHRSRPVQMDAEMSNGILTDLEGQNITNAFREIGDRRYRPCSSAFADMHAGQDRVGGVRSGRRLSHRLRDIRGTQRPSRHTLRIRTNELKSDSQSPPLEVTPFYSRPFSIRIRSGFFFFSPPPLLPSFVFSRAQPSLSIMN